MKIYDLLKEKAKKGASYFCLLDPDRLENNEAIEYAQTCESCGVDGLLVGSSMMLNNDFNSILKSIKENVNLPVIIFPGIFNFVSPYADALLLLSVISSRNPQMLIGEQVRAAPLIKKFGIEAIGTAYMLIDSGITTSVNFMSGSLPIPRDKTDIAIAHALAAQYLGMKILYLDAGSGGLNSIPEKMISGLKANIDLPIFVGGGIKTPEEARLKAEAGADFIVTGNILEKDFNPEIIKEFVKAVHSVKH